jgi:hypothetical protein
MLTSVVGRAAVAVAVAGCRLVTLTATRKIRVALQAARELAAGCRRVAIAGRPG